MAPNDLLGSALLRASLALGYACVGVGAVAASAAAAQVSATRTLGPAERALLDDADRAAEAWQAKVESGDLDGGVRLLYDPYRKLVDSLPDDPRAARLRDHMRAALDARPSAKFEAYVARIDAKLRRSDGDLTGAIEDLERGLDALMDSDAAAQEQLGHLLQTDLAVLLIPLAEFDRAEELLLEAQADLKARDASPASSRSDLYGAWFEYHYKLGRMDRAKPFVVAQKAAAFEPGAHPNLKVAWVLHKASLDTAIDEHEALLIQLNEILGTADWLPANGATRGLIEVRKGLTEYHLELGDPRREPAATRTLQTALDRGLPSGHRLSAHKILARIQLARGDLDGAARWIEAARADIGDTGIDGPEPSWSEASEVAELSLRLALKRGATGTDLRAAVDQMERQGEGFLGRWGAMGGQRGELGFLHFDTRESIIGAWVDGRLALAGEDGDQGPALDLCLRALGMGQLARELGGGPVGEILVGQGALNVLADVAPEGGGALVYLPSLGRSHVFAVDAARILHAPLVHTLRLERLRDRLSLAIDAAVMSGDGGAQGQLDVAAELMGEALLPPKIRDRIAGWSGLVVVGLDTLGYVPFECLPVGESSLGDILPIAYLPSSEVGRALLDRRTPSTGPLAVDLALFGAPEHSAAARKRWPSIDTVPWDSARSNLLTGPYRADRTRVLTGTAVTKDALLSTNFAGTATLQIVGHGAYDVSLERPAMIVMTGTDQNELGSFTGDDVRELKCVPPLVLLTTCGAGRSPLRRGEDGSAHLGGGFLAAGAQCVVLSRTDVPANATMELMGRFHRYLREPGATPATALFRARRSLRSHPDYGRVERRGLVHVLGLGFEPVPGLDQSGSAMAADTGGRSLALLLTLLAAASLAITAVVARGRRTG